eukprot:917404-Prorocentrum_minimum.AAC.2
MSVLRVPEGSGGFRRVPEGRNRSIEETIDRLSIDDVRSIDNRYTGGAALPTCVVGRLAVDVRVVS